MILGKTKPPNGFGSQKNANLGTSSNSCATFQYVYYAFQPVEITLYMACGQQCYLIIENSNTRKTTKVTQLPTTNNVGMAHKLTLEQGAESITISLL